MLLVPGRAGINLGRHFFKFIDNPWEPLINSMTTLARSRFRYQGALSQACVKLSRKCNDESGIGCVPLRAGPGAHRYGADALAKGLIHCFARRLAAGARLLQSGH